MCACGCGQSTSVAKYDRPERDQVAGQAFTFVRGHHGKHDIVKRFWEQVKKDGPMHPVLKTNCWLWTGACVKYGMAWTGEKVTGAHRFSWFLAYGTWPENNACHHCDTPLCVRPDHLFDGDDQANTDDAKNKGRWPRGSDVGFSKLTESIVLEIRKKYADGASQRHLAKEYNVTQPNIGFIVRGDTWNHIPTLCSTEGRSVSKLTEEKVREIRESKDVTSDFLAEKYGVSRRTINQILSNETWKSKERT